MGQYQPGVGVGRIVPPLERINQKSEPYGFLVVTSTSRARCESVFRGQPSDLITNLP